MVLGGRLNVVADRSFDLPLARRRLVLHGLSQCCLSTRLLTTVVSSSCVFCQVQTSRKLTIFFIRPPEGRAYVLPQMYLFLFFRHAFSEGPRPIALKLCHMIRIWPYFIIPLQKFGVAPPKKFGGQKHAKFRSILDHFRF